MTEESEDVHPTAPVRHRSADEAAGARHRDHPIPDPATPGDTGGRRRRASVVVDVLVAALVIGAMPAGIALSIERDRWQWWVSGLLVALTAVLLWAPANLFVTELGELREARRERPEEDPPRPLWTSLSGPTALLVASGPLGALGSIWSVGSWWAWAGGGLALGTVWFVLATSLGTG